MDYRKRNLAPKMQEDCSIKNLLLDDEFLTRLDVFGLIRKQLFTCQQENRLTPAKPCTVTHECFKIYINGLIKKLQTSSKYKLYLSNPDLSSEKIKQRLIKEFAKMQNISPKKDEVNISKEQQCEQIGIKEIQQVYIGRLSKLMDKIQVHKDDNETKLELHLVEEGGINYPGYLRTEDTPGVSTPSRLLKGGKRTQDIRTYGNMQANNGVFIPIHGKSYQGYQGHYSPGRSPRTNRHRADTDMTKESSNNTDGYYRGGQRTPITMTQRTGANQEYNNGYYKRKSTHFDQTFSSFQQTPIVMKKPESAVNLQYARQIDTLLTQKQKKIQQDDLNVMEFDKQDCASDDKTVDGVSRINTPFLHGQQSNNESNSQTSSFLGFDAAHILQLKLMNASNKSPLGLSQCEDNNIISKMPTHSNITKTVSYSHQEVIAIQ